MDIDDKLYCMNRRCDDMIYWIFAGIIALIATVLTIAYICYRITFYTKDRIATDPDIIDIPNGAIYEPYRESMEKWIRQTRKLPSKEYRIQSFDGLDLYAKYYEYAPDAPIELMFHGYRGNAERDLSGGVQRCFKLGHSAFIVDQRCSGKSGGNTITFGVNEHKDCLAWVDFIAKNFGPDAKIILTGISMGASTVLMAAGNPLPSNVIGVLADCGYTSAKEIIQVVIKKLNLPAVLAYPFVWLGARIFGGFDLHAPQAIDAMKKCSVPVIFFHGEDDDFVPCYMSRANFDACSAKKMLITVPGAGHGLCYPVDPEGYLKAMQDFFPSK